MIKNLGPNEMLRKTEPQRSGAASSEQRARDAGKASAGASFAEVLGPKPAPTAPVPPVKRSPDRPQPEARATEAKAKTTSDPGSDRVVARGPESVSGRGAQPRHLDGPRVEAPRPERARPDDEADVASAPYDEAAADLDSADEFDGSQFKKIERPLANPRDRVEKPKPAEVDAKAAAGLGAAFFGAQATRPGALGAEKIDESARTVALEEFRDDQAQAKQEAVMGFMQEMQAQFGVGPRDIVQAFAKLDQDSLMAPPEEARESFLDNLGLTGASRLKAGAMYDAMAQQTGEAMRNERFAERELDASFEVLSPTESRIRQLNDSLDKLNDSFFRRGQASSGPFSHPYAAEADGAARLQDAGGQDQKRGAKLGAAGLGAAGAAGATQAKAVAAQSASTSALGAFSLDPSQLGDAAPDFESDSLDADAFDAGRAFDPNVAPNLNPAQIQANAQASTAAGRNAYAANRAKAEEIGSSVGKKSAAGQSAAAAPADSALPSGDASAALAGAASGPRPVVAGAAGGTSAMLAPGAKPSPEETEANIQDIIRQASVIAKKGGGEMRMELRPEGIGHVNLKVTVTDGQVNVQMVTESNDAKRLLESSLHDLKSGLTAHKLQLETLKIDSHDGIRSQLEQQQRDAQREQARQFAGDFMGGFREERESFRQGFSDNLPVRSYRGAPQAQAGEGSSKSDGARSQSARRLNLVA